MRFLTNRDGSISIFRVGLVIAALGALFIVGSFLFAQFEIMRRQSPLNIDPPDGAVLFQESDLTNTSRQIIYQMTNADPEIVAEFYKVELDEHLGGSENDAGRERCVRQPSRGEFTASQGYEPGNGRVPFFWRCVFDDSIAGGLGTGGATRFTTVTIYPGVRDDAAEPPTDYTGSTFIVYDQVWAG